MWSIQGTIPIHLSLMGMVHKPFAASFHYNTVCSLALTATGISSKLPAFPFPKEYKSHWQRWKRENVTAKSGELCALSWREVDTGDKALFVLELCQTGHMKLFILGISNK